jgi:hypothetical protein
MPVETAEAQKAQSHMIFLMNFYDELRRKVPTRNSSTRRKWRTSFVSNSLEMCCLDREWMVGYSSRAAMRAVRERAHDPRVGRDVALKVSREQFSERFAREARAIAALNHPNTCQLYDVGPN